MTVTNINIGNELFVISSNDDTFDAQDTVYYADCSSPNIQSNREALVSCLIPPDNSVIPIVHSISHQDLRLRSLLNSAGVFQINSLYGTSLSSFNQINRALLDIERETSSRSYDYTNWGRVSANIPHIQSLIRNLPANHPFQTTFERRLQASVTSYLNLHIQDLNSTGNRTSVMTLQFGPDPTRLAGLTDPQTLQNLTLARQNYAERILNRAETLTPLNRSPREIADFDISHETIDPADRNDFSNILGFPRIADRLTTSEAMPSLRDLHNQRAITLSASQLQRLDSIERLFINRRMNVYLSFGASNRGLLSPSLITRLIVMDHAMETAQRLGIGFSSLMTAQIRQTQERVFQSYLRELTTSVRRREQSLGVEIDFALAYARNHNIQLSPRMRVALER